ncbi:MAG: hypothetical protein PHE18_01605 [Candidatus Omnitrophica bacterium]|nr:hypothetical protein [Candidatus Omnitrophota bacterium]
MRNYSTKDPINTAKAQATIEFGIALVLAVLFLFLSANLFVWLNQNIVKRQRDYEQTRVESASSNPGKVDFYTHYKPMNVFTSGGSKK